MDKQSICAFLGMEPKDLATALHVPLITVNNWELGYAIPDLGELVKLMKYSGLSADEILLGKKPELIDISDLRGHEKKLVKEVYQSFLYMNRKDQH